MWKTARAVARTAAVLIFGAASLATDAREKEATVYVARGVDSDLLQLVPDALRGDLRFDDTHFAAMGLFRPIDTPAQVQRAFDWLRVPNTTIGVEGILAKHWGMQSNAEVAVALSLRFAGVEIGPARLRAGLGFGLSYAAGTPSYEDGPRDDPARRYRLQNFNSYEFEGGWRTLPGWSVVARVHHRSGIYGVIAPRHVGSNFVAVGVRRRF